MKTTWCWLCMAMVILGAAWVCAQPRPTLTVGAYDFSPYHVQQGMKVAPDRIGYGVDLDILVEVLKRSGCDHTIRWVPFLRLKTELMEKGTIDVSNTFFYKEAMPAEKQILYDFGGDTVFYKRQADSRRIALADDLRGLTIGAVRGDSYGAEFQQLREKGGLTIEEVASDQQNFMKLAAGRLDLLVVNSVVGGFLAKTMDLKAPVETVPLQFGYGTDPKKAGIYIIFSKQTDQAIVETVRQKVVEILKDGTHKKIKEAYGVSADPFVYEYYGIPFPK